MDKEFEEWYQQNERRFHCGHFDEKQIAYSAWIEGRNQALSMSGVVGRSEQLICPECENPYPHVHIDGSRSCEDCGHEWAD